MMVATAGRREAYLPSSASISSAASFNPRPLYCSRSALTAGMRESVEAMALRTSSIGISDGSTVDVSRLFRGLGMFFQDWTVLIANPTVANTQAERRTQFHTVCSEITASMVDGPRTSKAAKVTVCIHRSARLLSYHRSAIIRSSHVKDARHLGTHGR